MRKTLMIAAIAAWFNFNVAALAQDRATEATVTRVEGSVTFTVAGGVPQPLAAGTKLAQGAEISTGEHSNATVVVHDGIVAIAASNSTITIDELSVDANGMRNATIGLKNGRVASSLDPARKSLNNYRVRTPEGIAKAEGTTYSVGYDGRTYSVTVVAGVVQSFTVAGVDSGRISSGSHFVANLGAGVGLSAKNETVPLSAYLMTTRSDTEMEAFALLAGAVAAASTNIADVNAVLDVIGNTPGIINGFLPAAVATAAATAASNPALTSANGGAMGVAASIVEAATATRYGKNKGTTIVVATAVAMASATGQTIEAVAPSLVTAAHEGGATHVKADSIVRTANMAIEKSGRPIGVYGLVSQNITTTRAVEITENGTTTTTAIRVTTPFPVNPDISVSSDD